MLNKQNLLIFFLILFVIFRIYQSGGLYQEVGNPELDGVAANFATLRDYLEKSVNNLLPQPQGGLLAGMILGARSTLPSDFEKALKNTSTIHMVVVSGQNLTLLAGFVLNMVGFLGRKKVLVINLFIVSFYALLTGFQIPVLRAAIMVYMASLAQFFHREADTSRVLVITALGMLIFNPNWLLSISFQLSFVATFGVAVAAPEIIKLVKFLPNVLKQDLLVSLSAQLLTVPIIAANFGTFSILGVLSNTFLLWTVAPIMVLGTLSLMVSLISPILGHLLSLLPNVFLTYFIYIVMLFNQSWGSISVEKLPMVVWIGYYVFLIGVFWMIKSRNIKNND